MQVNAMNKAQMMILESFAGARDEQELNALMDLLRNFYASRLEAEMQRLWDNGTLDQQALDQLREAHLRTPYHQYPFHSVFSMPRIVLDTNCLLQILGAWSQYHFLFSAFLEGAYSLCVSTEILLEYEEILRVKASPVAADLFMKDPYFHLGIVKQDPDDNKFVDCAFVSQADYIVTDDKHFDDVAQSEFPQFMVVGLDAFAEIMRNKNS